jgi:hypothetical protein
MAISLIKFCILVKHKHLLIQYLLSSIFHFYTFFLSLEFSTRNVYASPENDIFLLKFFDTIF